MPEGSLAERVLSDMTQAMRDRDEVKLSVLRMLKSSMQMAVTEKGRSGELTDEDVAQLIRRAIKQREDAAEQYRRGKADDRADEELREADILKAYLPSQLTDEELNSIISKLVADIGASGMKDIGRVMGQAVKAVSGRADGKRIKDSVTKLLSA